MQRRQGFTLIELPFDKLRVVRQRKPEGFTLIELLVVISIIALLISILLPSLRKARESARVLQCLSNCRTIAASMQLYTDDNDGYFCPKYCVDPNTGQVVSGESVFNWIGQKGTSGSYANRGANMRYLNRYIYNRRLEFDEQVEFARCPSDSGLQANNGIPLFESTGTSYGCDQRRDLHNLLRYNETAKVDGKTVSIPIRITEVLQPSLLVMGAEQGAQNYAWGENYPQTLSFHSPEPRFSVMFVDTHAAFIEVPKPQAPGQRALHGPGWSWDEEGRSY